MRMYNVRVTKCVMKEDDEDNGDTTEAVESTQPLHGKVTFTSRLSVTIGHFRDSSDGAIAVC